MPAGRAPGTTETVSVSGVVPESGLTESHAAFAEFAFTEAAAVKLAGAPEVVSDTDCTVVLWVPPVSKMKDRLVGAAVTSAVAETVRVTGTFNGVLVPLAGVTITVPL